jgi:hypothetical protein
MGRAFRLALAAAGVDQNGTLLMTQTDLRQFATPMFA